MAINWLNFSKTSPCMMRRARSKRSTRQTAMTRRFNGFSTTSTPRITLPLEWMPSLLWDALGSTDVCRGRGSTDVFAHLCIFPCKNTSYISHLGHITFALRITSSKALIGPIRKPGFRPAPNCLAGRWTRVSQVSKRRTLQSPSRKSKEAAPNKPQRLNSVLWCRLPTHCGEIFDAQPMRHLLAYAIW